MRDEWVDRMVESTRLGVVKSNPELIVNGLRELLGILEAMKLVWFFLGSNMNTLLTLHRMLRTIKSET